MIIYLILLLIFLFIMFNFLYFILPSLSPIPFFPTNKKDLDKIVNLLIDQKNKKMLHASGFMDHVIVDLGAGAGTVIFAAAKRALLATTAQNDSSKFPFSLPRQSISLRRCNVLSDQSKSPITFIAVEIHPLLVEIMQLRRLLHPARQNIQIMRADMFKMNYNKLLTFNSQLLTIYLYVGPFVMDRLIPKLNELPTHTRIVSYMYEVPGWEKKLVKTVKGVNNIYIYQID